MFDRQRPAVQGAGLFADPVDNFDAPVSLAARPVEIVDVVESRQIR